MNDQPTIRPESCPWCGERILEPVRVFGEDEPRSWVCRNWRCGRRIGSDDMDGDLLTRCLQAMEARDVHASLSTQSALRESLARIRAVVEAGDAWLMMEQGVIPDTCGWVVFAKAFNALADDDRRLLGMG